MTKTLIFKDSQNKHYEVNGSQKVFYFHHLGRYNNKSWSKVNLFVPATDESFNFFGTNCVKEANAKLEELTKLGGQNNEQILHDRKRATIFNSCFCRSN